MANPASHCRSVAIKVENRAGTVYVSSDDLEGLWLWGKDPEQLLGSIAPAIQALFKHNHGLDVTVEIPDDASGWLFRLRLSLTDPSAPARHTGICRVCANTETDLPRLRG